MIIIGKITSIVYNEQRQALDSPLGGGFKLMPYQYGKDHLYVSISKIYYP